MNTLTCVEAPDHPATLIGSSEAEPAVPVDISDSINRRILEVSEDQIPGFEDDPIGKIALESGIEYPVVVERLRAMLQAGTIRRIRQTLLATNLADGALVAWQVPEERLHAAFDFMSHEDPFSGHVVIRTADPSTPGASYRLWTTVKAPRGYSVAKHCELLRESTGSLQFRVMPAKRVFVLGVGHIRRQNLVPGSKSEELAEARAPEVVDLTDLEWRVVMALKRELAPEEITHDVWRLRALEAELPLSMFVEVARGLDRKKVIGRFSTFLEHVKPLVSGQRVTRFNALFHWAVPDGMEIRAGREIGRHHILTHCYWREAGPEFRNVSIMAVVHGQEKDAVLSHKAAIDDHLQLTGIPVSYTNVFWGGRSEIKPSVISPLVYRDWLRARGVDPDALLDD